MKTGGKYLITQYCPVLPFLGVLPSPGKPPGFSREVNTLPTLIFFPQFPVFIRQVSDSVHHYNITLWYFFLSSLYLSGKLVTIFIIMALLSLWYYFLSSLHLSVKLVTHFIIMVLLTLWYFFLISLFLSDKLVTLFIIMVLLPLWYIFLSSLYLSDKLMTLLISTVLLTLWYSFFS